MSHTMVNLPTRDGRRLAGRPVDDGYRIETDQGWSVCEVDAATPEGRAGQIARLLEEARDVGFQQGLRSVRAALGLN